MLQTDKLPGNNLIVYLWSWGQELKCYNILMDLEMKQNSLEDDSIKYCFQLYGLDIKREKKED